MFLLRCDRSQRHRHLLRRRVQQPRNVQQDVPCHRRRDAVATIAGEPTVVTVRLLRHGMDATEQFWRRRRAGRVAWRHRQPPNARGPRMLSSLRISQIYVLDQDEAVDFYVGKLGLEINTDQDLGFMRFLTVNVPGEPDREILLEKPGPPAMDHATADAVRYLLTKGAPAAICSSRRRMRARLTRAAGQGRRIHPGADGTALRNRLRTARSVRQPHPSRADVVSAWRARTSLAA